MASSGAASGAVSATAKGKLPDGFKEALIPHSNPPEVFVIDQKYSCREIVGRGSYGLVWWSFMSIIDYLLF